MKIPDDIKTPHVPVPHGTYCGSAVNFTAFHVPGMFADDRMVLISVENLIRLDRVAQANQETRCVLGDAAGDFTGPNGTMSSTDQAKKVVAALRVRDGEIKECKRLLEQELGTEGDSLPFSVKGVLERVQRLRNEAANAKEALSVGQKRALETWQEQRDRVRRLEKQVENHLGELKEIRAERLASAMTAGLENTCNRVTTPLPAESDKGAKRWAEMAPKLKALFEVAVKLKLISKPADPKSAAHWTERLTESLQKYAPQLLWHGANPKQQAVMDALRETLCFSCGKPTDRATMDKNGGTCAYCVPF